MILRVYYFFRCDIGIVIMVGTKENSRLRDIYKKNTNEMIQYLGFVSRQYETWRYDWGCRRDRIGSYSLKVFHAGGWDMRFH